jgi:hypothetical protein
VFDQQLYRIESKHEILTEKDGTVLQDYGVEQVNITSSELKEIALKNKRQSFISIIMFTLTLLALYCLIHFTSQPALIEQDFHITDCD